MKKRYYMSVATALAILVLVVTVLTGCRARVDSSEQEPVQEPVQEPKQVEQPDDEDLLSWQKDTSPFEFDIFFYGAWGTFYPWRGSLVEQYITEATGVTKNIIVPTGNEKEYLNVLIASGDLPDALVLEWYAPETKQLIEAGKIHSINDLSQRYAPELMDMISEDIKIYHSQEDGNLYYLPSFFTTKEEWEQGLEKHGARPLFIQKGIYEALGSPVIDTPDKLLEVLKQIRERFPDVKPFSIESPLDVNQWGLTGNLTMQFFAGIFAPETYGRDLYLEDGQIKLIVENPNFIEAVRFLNQIFREGLISLDTLLMRHEIWGEQVDTAQFAVTGRFPIDIWKNHNPKIMQLTNDEGKTYIPLTPYMRHNGKEPQFAGGRGAGWVASMVTKDAENPERIIRYFQYCWSDEGQLTNLFGREGETFEWRDGRPQYKANIMEELEADPASFSNKYGFEQRLIMWRSKWAGLQRIAVAPQGFTDYLKAVGQYGVDVWEYGLDNLDPVPASDEGVAYARIRHIWNEYLAKMVLAENDDKFNAAYEDAMKAITEAGLEEVKAAMTQNHLNDVARKQGNR